VQGAVDGGAGYAEQIGQFASAVVALAVEVHEMGLLAGLRSGCSPRSSPTDESCAAMESYC
jgi:hypothetical protein